MIGTGIGQGCASTAGCKGTYCWTYCGLSLSSGEWCYTTNGQSGGPYKRCETDDDCDPCDKCSGRCTAF